MTTFNAMCPTSVQKQAIPQHIVLTNGLTLGS